MSTTNKERDDMAKWNPWKAEPLVADVVAEHNAVLAELRKAEEQLAIVTADRDFYKAEFQPVSAARDKAEARVLELEAENSKIKAEAGKLGPVLLGLAGNVGTALGWEAEAKKRIAELESECQKWISENKRLVAENAEHRSHVSTVMSREAATRREYVSLSDYCVTADKRIADLEAQLAAVPRVDPDAWKTPLTIHNSQISYKMNFADGNKVVAILISAPNGHCGFSMLRADAARAAVWLASYAQAHGVPVGIRTNDALTQHWINRCREVESVFESEVNRLEAENAELRSKLGAPSAPPETLEALAEIGLAAYYATAPDRCKRKLSEIPEPCRLDTLDQTAAILRAARPNLDMTPDVLRNHCITSNAEEFLAFLNSSIRYGVELPEESSSNTGQLPVAPTDAQIEALARVLRSTYLPPKGVLTHWEKTCNTSRNEWRDVSRAAYAHIGAELAAVTEHRDTLQNERQDHFSTLRQILECGETENWMDAANRLLSERDDLRRQLAESRKWNSETLAENNRLDKALEVERDRCTDLLSDKRYLEEQLAARATRPVKVRFDVTAEQAMNAWRDAEGIAVTEFFMNYLAAHAVLDVPPGVPSVEELHDIGLKAFDSHSGGTYHDSRVAQTAAIRDAVLAGVGECQECAKRVESMLNPAPDAKCAMCAKWEKQYNDMLRWHNDLDAKLCAARAALEGEA